MSKVETSAHLSKLLTKQDSLEEFFHINASCFLKRTIDYDRLKDDHPEVEFIGLVGFDTKQKRFILVEVNENPTTPEIGPVLSVREQEVLSLVAMGYTNAQTAQNLTIAKNTVRVHLQNIFAKLNVRTRTEAAMVAVQQGWVTK